MICFVHFFLWYQLSQNLCPAWFTSKFLRFLILSIWFLSSFSQSTYFWPLLPSCVPLILLKFYSNGLVLACQQHLSKSCVLLLFGLATGWSEQNSPTFFGCIRYVSAQLFLISDPIILFACFNCCWLPLACYLSETHICFRQIVY